LATKKLTRFVLFEHSRLDSHARPFPAAWAGAKYFPPLRAGLSPLSEWKTGFSLSPLDAPERV